METYKKNPDALQTSISKEDIDRAMREILDRETPELRKRMLRETPIIIFEGGNEVNRARAETMFMTDRFLSFEPTSKIKRLAREELLKRQGGHLPTWMLLTLRGSDLDELKQVVEEGGELRDKVIILYNARKLQWSTGWGVDELVKLFDSKSCTALFATDEAPRDAEKDPDYTVYGDPMNFDARPHGSGGERKRHSNAFSFAFLNNATLILTRDINNFHEREDRNPNGLEMRMMAQRALEEAGQDHQAFHADLKAGKVRWDDKQGWVKNE